ncbi:MAG: hypothetical protein ACR2PT_02365 [Endozoicomonas sp.]
MVKLRVVFSISFDINHCAAPVKAMIQSQPGEAVLTEGGSARLVTPVWGRLLELDHQGNGEVVFNAHFHNTAYTPLQPAESIREVYRHPCLSGQRCFDGDGVISMKTG